MCGRFAMDDKTNDLIEEFVLDGNDYRDWVPSFSIAPTDPVPVIRERASYRRWRGAAQGRARRVGLLAAVDGRRQAQASSVQRAHRDRRLERDVEEGLRVVTLHRADAGLLRVDRRGRRQGRPFHPRHAPARGRGHLHAPQGRRRRVVPDDVDHHPGGARRLRRGARPDAGLPRAGRLRPLALARQARRAGRARRAGHACSRRSPTRSPEPSRPTRSTGGSNQLVAPSIRGRDR